MTSPLTQARNAVAATFTTNFIGGETVLRGENDAELQAVPDAATWLHLSIEPGYENRVAFGAGPRNTERVLTGTAQITGLARLGEGDAVLLDLLDRAVDALRGRQNGALTFYRDVRYSTSNRSEDGPWVWRLATVTFQYRFQG